MTAPDFSKAFNHDNCSSSEVKASRKSSLLRKQFYINHQWTQPLPVPHMKIVPLSNRLQIPAEIFLVMLSNCLLDTLHKNFFRFFSKRKINYASCVYKPVYILVYYSCARNCLVLTTTYDTTHKGWCKKKNSDLPDLWISANVSERQNFADWSNFTVASFNGYFLVGVEC